MFCIWCLRRAEIQSTTCSLVRTPVPVLGTGTFIHILHVRNVTYNHTAKVFKTETEKNKFGLFWQGSTTTLILILILIWILILILWYYMYMYMYRTVPYCVPCISSFTSNTHIRRRHSDTDTETEMAKGESNKSINININLIKTGVDKLKPTSPDVFKLQQLCSAQTTLQNYRTTELRNYMQQCQCQCFGDVNPGPWVFAGIALHKLLHKLHSTT